MNKIGLVLIGACAFIAFEIHHVQCKPETSESLSEKYPGIDPQVIELVLAFPPGIAAYPTKKYGSGKRFQLEVAEKDLKKLLKGNIDDVLPAIKKDSGKNLKRAMKTTENVISTVDDEAQKALQRLIDAVQAIIGSD
uniref:Uncharacterized protein n=1 Tax=Strigamia maritima TaxID=126957 RepID=T1IVU2_STRMM